MALASTVSGDGTLVSYEPDERAWYVAMASGGRTKYTETTVTTVREWYALTEAAATTWANATRAAGESRKIDRVSKVSGGEYKAVSTIITKTYASEYIPPA
jgi:hypothetical protein